MFELLLIFGALLLLIGNPVFTLALWLRVRALERKS
jgi:hypothetical protein